MRVGRYGLGRAYDLLGQMICHASQTTLDQGRACSDVPVDSGGPIRRSRFFRQAANMHIPVLPDTLHPSQSLKDIGQSEGGCRAVLW